MGHKDILVLNKFYANEEDRMANVEGCNFIGHLENEPEACVAMTGCVGSEDVEFTILSTHVTKSPTFKWTKDGQVITIESSNEEGLYGKMEMVELPRSLTEGSDEITIDELESILIAAEENCSGSKCNLPETQHLQIRVGYDDGVKNELGGKSKVEAYIAAIWTHMQVNYCHKSLGSKVLVERLPGIKHYKGMKLKGDGNSLRKMQSHTVSDLGSADLMLYIGYNGPNYLQGGGIAYKPAVCEPTSYNKYKQSINVYGTSHSHMGALLAHEVGHNLGMSHDFDTSHGGNGNPGSGPCDEKGLMSYNSPPTLKWSTCSVKDFTAHYTSNKNSWCMPANPNACGGGGGGTTTTAAPNPGCNASTNDKNCCTSSNPCSIGKGDCDKDSHCAGDLECGKNNCKQFDNAWSDASFDCCEDGSGGGTPTTAAPTPGCNARKNDKNCCKSSNPCSIGEGDCDKDSHCAGNLVCGKNNCKQFDNAWSDASFDCCEEANQGDSRCDASANDKKCCTSSNHRRRR